MIDWVVDATVWGQAARGDNPDFQVSCREFLTHLDDNRHSIGIDTVGHILRESERQMKGAPDFYAIWGRLVKKSINPARSSKKLRVAVQELKIHKEDQVYFFVAEQLSQWLVGCETRWLNATLVSAIKRRNGILLCGPKMARNSCLAKCSALKS